jgi:predicted CXXCH cytochrome family protein
MKMSALNYALHRIGGGVATVLLVAGVLGSAPALAAGIKDTKHNLGTSNVTAGQNKVGGAGATAEICVFCHTPHGSDTSASVPLWNKKLGTPSTYTTYNSLGTSSLDGGTAPVGSVSLACLSCHDGSQALNVMINGSGSGNYNSAGAEYGTMVEGAVGNLDGNKLSATVVTNLTKDLRNDHPIGIQYAGGPNASGVVATVGEGTYTSANFNDKDFKAASVGSANGNTVWWVDTVNGTSGGAVVAGSAAREKTDMQLYTRGQTGAEVTLIGASSALSGGQPFVECASCHDPHSANPTFLRIENKGSEVCLACHIK